MTIKGIDRYENLSAVTVAADGSVDYGRPLVRFGDFSVPAAVAWVSDPIGRSPAVRAEFEMRNGSPVCLSVTITATPKGRPVTTADLASLPGLERKGLDAFKALGIRVFDDEDWRKGRNLHRYDQIHTPNPRDLGTALSKRPDEELERVAQVYRDNLASRPVEAVQLAFGLARRTTDRRIKAARDRGFLPQTTKGRKRA
jgi:hypothetical protein